MIYDEDNFTAADGIILSFEELRATFYPVHDSPADSAFPSSPVNISSLNVAARVPEKERIANKPASPTINTRAAMQDVFDMFNAPLPSERGVAERPPVMEDETISSKVFKPLASFGKIGVFRDQEEPPVSERMQVFEDVESVEAGKTDGPGIAGFSDENLDASSSTPRDQGSMGKSSMFDVFQDSYQPEAVEDIPVNRVDASLQSPRGFIRAAKSRKSNFRFEIFVDEDDSPLADYPLEEPNIQIEANPERVSGDENSAQVSKSDVMADENNLSLSQTKEALEELLGIEESPSNGRCDVHDSPSQASNQEDFHHVSFVSSIYGSDTDASLIDFKKSLAMADSDFNLSSVKGDRVFSGHGFEHILSPIAEQASTVGSESLSNITPSTGKFLSLLNEEHSIQALDSPILAKSDPIPSTKDESEALLNEATVETFFEELLFDNPCNPFRTEVTDCILKSAQDRFGTPSNLFFELDACISKDLEDAAKIFSGNQKSKAASTLKVEPLLALDMQFSLASGRFVLLEKLGQGGFGSVFLVQNVEEDEFGTFMNDSENSFTASSQGAEKINRFALKVQIPSAPWEFYVLSQLHHRLSLSNAPSKVINSIVRPYSCHILQGESCLLLSYGQYGTLLDSVNNSSSTSSYITNGSRGFDELLVAYFTIEIIGIILSIHNAGVSRFTFLLNSTDLAWRR